MKRLEEILEKAWSKNTNNEPLDEKYVGETTAIHEAMKLYAREVAQASLQKAAENSILKLTFSSGKIATSSTWRMPDGELIELQKSSITNPNNITLL
ncbi:hypothetical protein RG089_002846 [Elizabethkingia anophelis]|nr:hypothetical protein [Elizabethkingia anophelis]ELB1894339.1 hypothetical protein [Elizabethkingia anophelis]